MPFSKKRKEYSSRVPLDLGPDPIEAFRKWYSDAEASPAIEPNSMALATCGRDGQPSVRIVLLKDVTSEGFTFFSNYQSRKAQDLAENPAAALCWYWDQLERQVRAEGSATRLSHADSDRYFAQRPFGAQVLAWVSRQSRPLDSREELIRQRSAFESGLSPEELHRPEHWGGYLLKPHHMEFWQGAPDRMHDRLLYIREGGKWRIERLYP